jgi:ubiquitin carboxyl-terminal hydrolase 7
MLRRVWVTWGQVHCHQQMSDILYYEILDIPLPELERLKILKVAFHNHKTEQVEEQQVRT